MKVVIEGKNLVITIPIEEPLTKSKSGKSFILASTRGNKQIEIEGTIFFLGVNCYTYPADAENFRSNKPKKKLTEKEKKKIEEHNKKVSERIADGSDK